MTSRSVSKAFSSPTGEMRICWDEPTRLALLTYITPERPVRAGAARRVVCNAPAYTVATNLPALCPLIILDALQMATS